MKNIILFVLFISFQSSSQIFLNGATDYWDKPNGSITAYVNVTAPSYTLPSTYLIDAGTNIYEVYFRPFSDVCISKFIARISNYWYLIEAYGAVSGGSCSSTVLGGYFIKYKHSLFSTSIDPPCAGTWVPFSGTGAVLNINITGSSCFTPPIIPAFVATPTSLSIPSLTAAMIAAIPSPTTGMMVWNNTINRLVIFNGISWQTI